MNVPQPMKSIPYQQAPLPFEARSAMHPDELVLEGIVVTQDAAGHANIAPMGPRVDRAITRLLLRPFRTAHTYQNLQATHYGVFHITDDVELLARAAIGRLQPPPDLAPIDNFPCPRLADACAGSLSKSNRWTNLLSEFPFSAPSLPTVNCGPFSASTAPSTLFSKPQY